MLKVPRFCLGLGASANGLVHGEIIVFDNGVRIYDGGTYRYQPYHIDSDGFSGRNTQNLTFVISQSIKYLLIVEKETVFHKLCKGKWTSKNCILVTGRGYPPLITRAFVSTLIKSTEKQGRHLEMYCLVDNDPHGLDIFLAYQQGTINAPESYLYALTNLMYLGLEWCDMETFQISKKRTLKMNEKDLKKIETMDLFLERKKVEYLEKFNISENSVDCLTLKRIMNQLKISKRVHKKLEIESIDNLDQWYIPRKIELMKQYYKLNSRPASPLMDVDDDL